MKPLFQGVCTALVTPFRLDFVHLEAFWASGPQAGLWRSCCCGIWEAEPGSAW